MIAQKGFVLLSLLAVGCTPVYIRPPAATPLLEEAGNVHLAASGGTNGFAAQGAVAATDAFGVLANVSGDPQGDNRHFYAEGGLGFFVPFGVGRFELYSGMGAGASEAFDDSLSTPTSAQGWYLRPYAQANIGLSTDYFDIGAAIRGAYVHYEFARIDGVSVDQSDSAFFFEPTGFMRFGYRGFKFETQIGFTGPDPGRPLQAEVFFLSFGFRGFIY